MAQFALKKAPTFLWSFFVADYVGVCHPQKEVGCPDLVFKQQTPHPSSKISQILTVSMGVGTRISSHKHRVTNFIYLGGSAALRRQTQRSQSPCHGKLMA